MEYATYDEACNAALYDWATYLHDYKDTARTDNQAHADLIDATDGTAESLGRDKWIEVCAEIIADSAHYESVLAVVKPEGDGYTFEW